MSPADIATTSEMDQLDQLGAKAFDGFLVRKDLVRKYSRQYPVPTYVVESAGPLLRQHRSRRNRRRPADR